MKVPMVYFILPLSAIDGTGFSFGNVGSGRKMQKQWLNANGIIGINL